MASTLIASPVSIASAFSPGHVTGFFEIPEAAGGNPLQRGSRGAGFSVDRGITTSVEIYESNRQGHKILINGSSAPRAEVSKWVIQAYFRMTNRPYFVKVDHDISIPVGYGLGSSGAGALSLSYALNEALDTGLDRSAAAQIAHNAEIACRTGLGTVLAEYAGGFEMRTVPGAPGIGKVTKIGLEGYKAVVLCLAPISTRTFLSNREDEINGLGGKMLSKLSQSQSVDDFMKMSREFAETLGLAGGKCRVPIDALNAAGFEAGVAMFGETVFSLVPSERSGDAVGALSGFGGQLLVCNIDSDGARVL